MRSPFTRRLALGVALATVSVVVNPAPALASVPYNGVCGDGHNVVNSAAITGGTAYLTYDNDVGENCVVVIREEAGEAMPMDAVLKAGTSTFWERDPGEWTTHAGPVYLEAAGECVDWGGTIGNEWVLRNGTNCG